MKPIYRHPTSRVVLAAAIVIGAAVWAMHAYASTAGTTIFLPVGQKDGIALPPPDEASQRLSVPEGFAVRIFARDLNNPRLMAIGPDRQLYVAERGSGQIVRLPDADGNGLADATQVVAGGLNSPHNLEWHDGAFYVAENDKISKLADANGDGDFLDPGERTTVTGNIPCCGGHSSRTLHFGPDGKLYVAAGSSCNICVEDDKPRPTTRSRMTRRRPASQCGPKGCATASTSCLCRAASCGPTITAATTWAPISRPRKL
jgi:glucose/arabinose dehydrogenase